MSFERVLQIEHEERPAGVEPVDVVVPRAAVVEARVHQSNPDTAALGFQVIVEGEAHHATVGRRHLTGGLHPPQGLPHCNRLAPHLLRVPADADAAAFAGRHRGVRRKPPGDSLARRESLPHLLECGIDVDGQVDHTVGALEVVGHVVSMLASRPPSGSVEGDGTAGYPHANTRNVRPCGASGWWYLAASVASAVVSSSAN